VKNNAILHYKTYTAHGGTRGSVRISSQDTKQKKEM
jgi:hypothetical protein